MRSSINRALLLHSCVPAVDLLDPDSDETYIANLDSDGDFDGYHVRADFKANRLNPTSTPLSSGPTSTSASTPASRHHPSPS